MKTFIEQITTLIEANLLSEQDVDLLRKITIRNWWKDLGVHRRIDLMVQYGTEANPNTISDEELEEIWKLYNKNGI